MIKTIQIYLDGSPDDETRIAHAETVMGSRACHLVGLYPNVLPTFSPLPGEPGAGAMVVYEERLRLQGAATAARLRARLDRATPTSELRKIEGPTRLIARRFASEARTGDMLIAPCPYRGNADCDAIVDSVLLEGGGCLYLVPPGRRPAASIGTALVAWSDAREAARALHEALPLLRAASRIQLVLVADEDGQAETSAAMADLAASLDRHGLAVEVATVAPGPSIAQALLEQAGRICADVLVAGAYGHARWREKLVGGVTRELLSRSPCPLLVAH